MAQINDRLDKMKGKILEESFIEGKGLGNEVNFYIFDYDPKYELLVRDHIDYLIKDLSPVHYNRQIIIIDLYEIVIELAKEKDVFEKIFEIEKNMDKEYVYRALTSFTKPEWVLNKIEEKIDSHNVIFLTGIGKIYPFLRSHNVLNNLQEILLENIPVILFYPGQYNEQDLQLFNILDGNNYYRAFPLINY